MLLNGESIEKNVELRAKTKALSNVIHILPDVETIDEGSTLGWGHEP